VESLEIRARPPASKMYSVETAIESMKNGISGEQCNLRVLFASLRLNGAGRMLAAPKAENRSDRGGDFEISNGSDKNDYVFDLAQNLAVAFSSFHNILCAPESNLECTTKRVSTCGVMRSNHNRRRDPGTAEIKCKRFCRCPRLLQQTTLPSPSLDSE